MNVSEPLSPLPVSGKAVRGVDSHQGEAGKTFTDVHEVHVEHPGGSGTRRRTALGTLVSPGDVARLWTPEDTAGFLRISVPAVYQMVYRREIPHLKVGRRLRFEERRLREWLHEKEVQA